MRSLIFEFGLFVRSPRFALTWSNCRLSHKTTRSNIKKAWLRTFFLSFGNFYRFGLSVRVLFCLGSTFVGGDNVIVYTLIEFLDNMISGSSTDNATD
jgi:hypothetical protein